MRRAQLVLLSLLMFGVVSQMAAQTTYTQTTFTCGATSCSNAQFTPSAMLSYNDNLQYCGGSFTGAVIWKGAQYLDFVGTYKFAGYYHYPFSLYQLEGTFDGGRYAVVETFKTYRGCAPLQNVSGNVVGP
jgi:hypothetical protein